MARYDFSKIEKKWQKTWEKQGLFKAEDRVPGVENFYHLVMFPYPSGDLHIGHWYNFAPADVFARFMRMAGHNVMSPIGFDAFGLPAENAAIKRNIHPREWTMKNIETMTEQLKSMGSSYDWSRLVVTCLPDYYRWNQWLFLQFLKHGLAYRKKAPANWCPSCKTVLANEQVVDGRCERCATEVVQKEIEQWLLKITDYAERLLRDLDGLDWPEKTKTMQRNWIGRSEGARITFPLVGVPGEPDKKHSVEVFTTRPDTLFGATFLVISPELAEQWMKLGWRADEKTRQYVMEAQKKRELARLEEAAEKTGVPAGIGAINPATKEKIPVWISDYVLAGYGTGAIMAVPAHDARDFEFAKRFGLPVRTVIEPVTGEPRDHEEYRTSIVAIVEDPKTGNVLSINWGKELGGNLFVGGGREGKEDPREAAEREIREETGYRNLDYVGKTETIHHHYIAHSKGVNRVIDAVGLHFRLADDGRDAPSLEKDEEGKFTVEWLTPDEAAAKVADPLHQLVFRRLIRGEPYTGSGVLAASGSFDGMSSEEAMEKIADFVKGKREVQYRLRDWLISRQRYWGTPIPVVYCEACGIEPVPEDELPVLLPDLEDFRPANDGRSPLARVESFLKTKCPKCGGDAERETDTMDTFFDSSWYFLRYADPQNGAEFADKEKMRAWLPVRTYIGGAEHTVLHLLYSRFFTKFLADQGYLDFTEPFMALRHQGIILGPDGQKMSKSRGNVVDPDDLVARFGADSVRLHLCFMAEYDKGGPWNPNGILGVHRFLERVFKLSGLIAAEESKHVARAVQKTVKKVGEDIRAFKFNTAVSALMIGLNEIEAGGAITQASFEAYLRVLAPFAPHLTEELWEEAGHKDSIHRAEWPGYDEALVADDTFTLVVQVNGKVRDSFEAPSGIAEDEAKKLTLERESVKKHIGTQEPKRVIYVPGRLINIVI